MQYRRIKVQSDGRPAPPRAEGFGLVWLLGSLLALAIAGTVQADSNGKGEGKSLSVDEVGGKLEAIRLRNGMLTAADFLGVVRPSDRLAVPIKDLPTSYRAFVAMLRPPIKKDDLVALHEATREAIHDVRVVYDVRADGINLAGLMEKTRERQEFAMSGEKLLFRRLVEGDGKTKLRGQAKFREMRAIAYDGKVERSSIERDDGYSGGIVDIFKGRSRFYDVEANPLLLSMLVDSDRDVGIPDDYRDLLRLIKRDSMAVFEERRQVDGRSCILVGEPMTLAYLDPKRNFCVTQFEHSEMPSEGPIRKGSVRQLSDFLDCGNGLWLPKRIVVDEYSNGKPRFHREVIVREWHVNEGISDSFFEEAIPEGVIVNDVVSETSYIKNKKGSIQSMVDLALPNNGRQGMRRWWLLATNAAIVVLVLLVVGVRRRVRSGPTGGTDR